MENLRISIKSKQFNRRSHNKIKYIVISRYSCNPPFPKMYYPFKRLKGELIYLFGLKLSSNLDCLLLIHTHLLPLTVSWPSSPKSKTTLPSSKSSTSRQSATTPTNRPCSRNSEPSFPKPKGRTPLRTTKPPGGPAKNKPTPNSSPSGTLLRAPLPRKEETGHR